MAEPTRSLWTLLTLLLGLTLHWTQVTGQQCAKLTTFNTGLTPVVGPVNQREKIIEKALQNSDTDVLCLQEVWYESTVSALTTGLAREYPYHYSALHRRVNQLASRSTNSWLSFAVPDAPCTGSEVSYIVQNLGVCALTHACGVLSKFGSCLAENCQRELRSYQISQSCLSCTLFSLNSLKDISTKCGNVPGFQKSRFNGPGLVLLSKKPIRSARYVNFFPGKKTFVQRGYIDANIDGLGKVVCTHLSADIDDYLEFDLPYKNYEEQQGAEIRALSRLTSTDHILMGDLNTGPAMTFLNPTRNVAGNFAQNFKKLTDIGYTSPYVDQVKLCTYCSTNRFTKGKDSYILDHVMTHGDRYKGIVARRVLISQDRQTLSDHYGVEVRLCALGTPARRTSQRGFFQRLFG